MRHYAATQNKGSTTYHNS